MFKFIFTGPEATGKTTLTNTLHQQLTRVLKAKEFSRFYLSEKMRTQGTHTYTFEELTYIAKGQMFVEENAQNIAQHFKLNIVVCDTDLITLKIWSNEVFKKCDPHILNMIQTQFQNDMSNYHYRHYFVCSPDNIEWQPDPLRENPFDRERLFEAYIKELELYRCSYTILRGGYYGRLHTVLNRINDIYHDSAYSWAKSSNDYIELSE